MPRYAGKFQSRSAKQRRPLPFVFVFLSFFLIEVFAFPFLSTTTEEDTWSFFRYIGYADENLNSVDFWPLAFGLVWAALLAGIVWFLPWRAARILYGCFYFSS